MREPRASYRRCLEADQLADSHYRRFLASHPDIPEYFANVDPAKHKELLRSMHGMLLVFDRTRGTGTWAMERLARMHGPSGMNVPESLLGLWLDSLIEAVRECDPAFDGSVETAWRRLGQEAIDFIVEYLAESTGPGC